MKIKVFKFEVSNFTSTFSKRNREEANQYQQIAMERISTEQDIEYTINNFITYNSIIDIKINTIDTEYHNNGCSNTVHLMYTIMYE